MKFLDKFIVPIIIIVTVILISIAVYLIFFPDEFPNINSNDRVGLAQLSIGIASISAFFLAAWEFSKALRKPKLDLWLSQQNISSPRFLPTKELIESASRPSSHYFKFHFILENYGNAIGRWVKVRVVLDPAGSNIDHHFKRETEYPEYWNNKQNERSFTHNFDGRESFVIYSRKSKKDSYGECENLGKFEVNIAEKDRSDIGTDKLTLNYSIYADGMEVKNGKLFLTRKDK